MEYINKNNIEIKNIFNAEILNFKKKKEFKEYVKKEPIAIINPKIYYLIKMNGDKKDLSYYCSSLNGIITVYFNEEKSEVKFYQRDNILLNDHRIKSQSIFKKIKNFFSLKNNLFNYIYYLLGYNLIPEKKENDSEGIDNKFHTEEKDGFQVIYHKDNNNNDKIEEKEDIINNIDNNNKNIIDEIKEEPIKKEDNFEIVIEDKKKEIKSYFQFCPNIGLQNIGATCYMNATLQCFAHIEKFINFFKYNSQINQLNNKYKQQQEKKLYSSFKLLIENLWPDDYLTKKEKYYAPDDFKKKISEMNPLFEGIAANDAKDLVNFIIMTLHEELNKVNTQNIIYDENENIDQTNQKLVLKSFLKEFTSRNQSIISDLFYAMNCSITECTICHHKLYNYQIYFFMVFPLEEIRKYKCNYQLNYNNGVLYNNFFNNNMIINKSVNIYDCFDYDKKINLMTGDNAMYCNYCQATTNCNMYTYLVAGPEIFILLLNRGKGKEFDVKMEFYEEINLYNYIEYKDTGFKYKLIGVITHIGESGMGGHFIAYCKDPINGEWNKYNDAIVSKVEDFQNEVINFAMPYLLFYQKCS